MASLSFPVAAAPLFSLQPTIVTCISALARANAVPKPAPRVPPTRVPFVLQADGAALKSLGEEVVQLKDWKGHCSIVTKTDR